MTILRIRLNSSGGTDWKTSYSAPSTSIFSRSTIASGGIRLFESHHRHLMSGNARTAKLAAALQLDCRLSRARAQCRFMQRATRFHPVGTKHAPQPIAAVGSGLDRDHRGLRGVPQRIQTERSDIRSGICNEPVRWLHLIDFTQKSASKVAMSPVSRNAKLPEERLTSNGRPGFKPTYADVSLSHWLVCRRQRSISGIQSRCFRAPSALTPLSGYRSDQSRPASHNYGSRFDWFDKL